jgi:hypothetical protein
MRKHFFGIALFTMIVVSFAFVFALSKLFVFDVPEIPGTPPPVSVRVKSSYYDLDSHRLVTEIGLDWKGAGSAPESLVVRRELYAAESSETVAYKRIEEVDQPFGRSRSGSITLESSDLQIDDPRANLYVRVTVGEGRADDSGSAGIAPVLFVHGERSKNR